jgi:hypothetical protein
VTSAAGNVRQLAAALLLASLLALRAPEAGRKAAEPQPNTFCRGGLPCPRRGAARASQKAKVKRQK